MSPEDVPRMKLLTCFPVSAASHSSHGCRRTGPLRKHSFPVNSVHFMLRSDYIGTATGRLRGEPHALPSALRCTESRATRCSGPRLSVTERLSDSFKSCLILVGAQSEYAFLQKRRECGTVYTLHSFARHNRHAISRSVNRRLQHGERS